MSTFFFYYYFFTYEVASLYRLPIDFFFYNATFFFFSHIQPFSLIINNFYLHLNNLWRSTYLFIHLQSIFSSIHWQTLRIFFSAYNSFSTLYSSFFLLFISSVLLFFCSFILLFFYFSCSFHFPVHLILQFLLFFSFYSSIFSYYYKLATVWSHPRLWLAETWGSQAVIGPEGWTEPLHLQLPKQDRPEFETRSLETCHVGSFVIHCFGASDGRTDGGFEAGGSELLTRGFVGSESSFIGLIGFESLFILSRWGQNF